jgi:DNA replication protein DnaC
MIWQTKIRPCRTRLLSNDSPRSGAGYRLETEPRNGRQGRLADHLTRMEFILLDELGYLPFAQSGGQRLFHLVSRLYERTSIIVTHQSRLR